MPSSNSQISHFYQVSRDPFRGGQSLTHSCLLAVNPSLEVVNGYIVAKTPYYITALVDDLFAATKAGQFPCGAVWDGNPAGAPIVEVPYGWLWETCPRVATFYKWTRQRRSMVVPVRRLSSSSSYILYVDTPLLQSAQSDGLHRLDNTETEKACCVVSIIPSRLVSRNLLASSSLILIFVGICVVCDTVIWLSTCFTFATPMLLSGFYETYLGYIIINFLQDKTGNYRLTLDMKARFLFVILCGNVSAQGRQCPICPGNIMRQANC